MTAKMRKVATLACAVVLWSVSALAADLGPVTEVAPGVKDSRQQVWPAVAWCEGAKCWLVAWREGCINDQETDIWCARVGADGKPLDPAGIRITSAKGVQDHPAVASDGKGFLVVWEDLRSDKDYDVYGARVSAEGKVLDADGILVAGGEHNQCRPTVAWAGGSYSVAWQAFAGAGLDGDGKTGYRICGAPVSVDGKAGNNQTFVDLQSPGYQIVWPVMASTGKGAAVASENVRNCMGVHGVAMLSGSSAGKPCWLASPGEHKASLDAPATLAWGNDAGLLVGLDSCSSGNNKGPSINGWRIDASGQAAASEPLVPFRHPNSGRAISAHATATMPHLSLAFDGKRYLLAYEDIALLGDGNGGQVRVEGVYLPGDGKLDMDELARQAFVIGEGKWNCILPAACAGPKDVCLVTYADVRGPDDTKAVARIVKHE
jgi:hypothetical protein